MAKFYAPLINEDIDSRFARIHKPFRVWLDSIAALVEVPVGFVHDYESVPIIKGTSKRGGVVHDYLCRIDSVPICTKREAADAYFEVMELRDTGDKRPDKALEQFDLWWRRWLKYSVVMVWPGYFHKHKVAASYEEMKE